MKKPVLLILLFNLISINWYGCSDKMAYYFLDNLDKAEIIVGEKEYVTRNSFIIDFDWREVLFEHPNSEVAFQDVLINDNAELRFGIGIEENTWETDGDGVLFEINVVDEKSQNFLLFSRYIDPKNNVEDRKWFDEQVDLSFFAGQKLLFKFKTTDGYQSNNHYDWAGWSNPQIITIKESNN